MSIIEIWNQSNFVVNAVMLILVIMSILSWYLIFFKIVILKKEQKNFQLFNQNIAEQIIRSNNWFKDLQKLKIPSKSRGNIDILLHKVCNLEPTLDSFDSHEAKKEILTMHLIQSLDDIRFRLDKGLTALASIGSSAPFVGLLGTVIGIYDALQNISSLGNSGLGGISAPISEALIATAIGLFVAIPAVLAYNFFVRSNRLQIQKLRHLAEQITVYLSNQPSKIAPKPQT